MSITIHVGDCLQVLRTLPADSFDSVVTDPPYHLTTGKKGGTGPASVNLNSPAGRARISAGFMGKAWDGGDVAFRPETWREVLRVMKPGAYLLAFGGTRTFHRLACAIEDAGFELRDCIANAHDGEPDLMRDCPWLFGWIYSTGFPKSLNVAKDIDRQLGAKGETVAVGDPVKRMIPGADQNTTGSWVKDSGREYQPGQYVPATPEAQRWGGWGTSLKPAWEPIVVARKPLAAKNVAANVLTHGTGAINIDGCRIEGEPVEIGVNMAIRGGNFAGGGAGRGTDETYLNSKGRWPANLTHDGSDAVVALFPSEAGSKAPVKGTEASRASAGAVTGGRARVAGEFYADAGSAARFFYCPKASPNERDMGLSEAEKRVVSVWGGDEDDLSDGKKSTVPRANTHPTVKPLALMRYLVRLVTPPGGTVLDNFCGSGSTLLAADLEGFDAIGIELGAHHATIAAGRCSGDTPLFGAQVVHHESAEP